MLYKIALPALLLGLSSTANAESMGPIDPVDTFDWLNADETVVLVDVRTAEEWRWVGHPGPNGLADSNGRGLAYKSGAGLIVDIHDGDVRYGNVVNFSWAIANVKTNEIYYLITGPDGKKKALGKNPDFEADILEYFGDHKPTLIFICRSGDRSIKAATAMALDANGGFDTYYVEGGFEGATNTSEHPGPDTGYRDVNGWRNARLPWNQNAAGAYNTVKVFVDPDPVPE